MGEILNNFLFTLKTIGSAEEKRALDTVNSFQRYSNGYIPWTNLCFALYKTTVPLLWRLRSFSILLSLVWAVIINPNLQQYLTVVYRYCILLLI